MTIVSMITTVKDNRIYVRLSSDIKQEFERVAAYQGLTPSAMLHSFIVKTVRQARETSPQIFKREAGETKNKSSESKASEVENFDKVMTLDEAKADDKKKKGKKQKMPSKIEGIRKEKRFVHLLENRF